MDPARRLVYGIGTQLRELGVSSIRTGLVRAPGPHSSLTLHPEFTAPTVERGGIRIPSDPRSTERQQSHDPSRPSARAPRLAFGSSFSRLSSPWPPDAQTGDLAHGDPSRGRGASRPNDLSRSQAVATRRLSPRGVQDRIRAPGARPRMRRATRRNGSLIRCTGLCQSR